MSIIERNIEGIKRICSQHAVSQLSVFGSVLTEKFNDNSDIDFLVTFKAMPVEDYADNYLQMSTALSELLGREVDLVEDNAIRNPIFRNVVNRTKVQIYGRV
ncbi:MAG: nucleotidyltransferase domain-containing protein [Bacteroidales bacterium]|nr:nucleotidyltransferase domain-containing protein [Bacteroidales bacterium]